jgi:hypothetical protein
MYPYRYCVSLRFWHPTIDPEVISTKLGKKPSRLWRAGEPRTTPKGNKLEGTWKDSYWTAPLHPKKSLSSRKTQIETFLSTALDELAPHSKFIKAILAGGGRAEFFVGLFGDKNYGFDLEPELLQRLGKIGLRLSLDIYPENPKSQQAATAVSADAPPLAP